MDSGKTEAIFADALSKIIIPNIQTGKIGKVCVINVKSQDDEILSEKLQIINDLVKKIPKVGKYDFTSLLMSYLNTKNNIGKFKNQETKSYFYVKSSSKFHKILFSLWIELLTGIDLKKEFGVKKDILFELGTNYRFPISSLELISTKNMIKALSKSARFIANGNILITENLESKAIALILSANVPKTKDFILLKGPERFLERIRPNAQSS